MGATSVCSPCPDHRTGRNWPYSPLFSTLSRRFLVSKASEGSYEGERRPRSSSAQEAAGTHCWAVLSPCPPHQHPPAPPTSLEAAALCCPAACKGPRRLAQPIPLSLKVETKAQGGRDWPKAGPRQPGSLLKGRSQDLAGGSGRVDVGRCGGKYQNVIGFIKGLVREPFRPGQRLGTGRELSSPVNPWATKAALC